MTNLTIEVVGAKPERFAATPILNFRLRVDETSGVVVHTLALRCQIRIEPNRRRYSAREAQRLLALFGETPRWGDTLRPFVWAHANLMVPGFTGSSEVALPVPCTYDFEVAAAKYLHSLEAGEIPLILLFSGTAFTRAEDGALRVDPVPWQVEANYRLPVETWRSMMDLYYPNSGWLRLDRQTLDALEQFKTGEALPTWEQAMETLLERAVG